MILSLSFLFQLVRSLLDDLFDLASELSLFVLFTLVIRREKWKFLLWSWRRCLKDWLRTELWVWRLRSEKHYDVLVNNCIRRINHRLVWRSAAFIQVFNVKENHLLCVGVVKSIFAWIVITVGQLSVSYYILIFFMGYISNWLSLVACLSILGISRHTDRNQHANGERSGDDVHHSVHDRNFADHGVEYVVNLARRFFIDIDRWTTRNRGR